MQQHLLDLIEASKGVQEDMPMHEAMTVTISACTWLLPIAEAMADRNEEQRDFVRSLYLTAHNMQKRLAKELQ